MICYDHMVCIWYHSITWLKYTEIFSHIHMSGRRWKEAVLSHFHILQWLLCSLSWPSNSTNHHKIPRGMRNYILIIPKHDQTCAKLLQTCVIASEQSSIASAFTCWTSLSTNFWTDIRWHKITPAVSWILCQKIQEASKSGQRTIENCHITAMNMCKTLANLCPFEVSCWDISFFHAVVHCRPISSARQDDHTRVCNLCQQLWKTFRLKHVFVQLLQHICSKGVAFEPFRNQGMMPLLKKFRSLRHNLVPIDLAIQVSMLLLVHATQAMQVITNCFWTWLCRLKRIFGVEHGFASSRFVFHLATNIHKWPQHGIFKCPMTDHDISRLRQTKEKYGTYCFDGLENPGKKAARHGTNSA